jgi:hypothetical protein
MKISTPVYVSISPILAMAALLVALLPVTSLLGCGQLGLDPDSTETAAVSASPGGDGDLVAATLDGREITVEEIDA